MTDSDKPQSPPDTSTPESDWDVVQEALKWASCVELGDTKEQTKRREDFYQPAKKAVVRLRAAYEQPQECIEYLEEELGSIDEQDLDYYKTIERMMRKTLKECHQYLEAMMEDKELTYDEKVQLVRDYTTTHKYAHVHKAFDEILYQQHQTIERLRLSLMECHQYLIDELPMTGDYQGNRDFFARVEKALAAQPKVEGI